MSATLTLLAGILTLYTAITFPIAGDGGASIFNKELNLIGGYSEAEGWLGEVREGFNPSPTENSGMMLMNSIGGEYYRKFSSEQGDYMTLDLQMRLTYNTSEDFKKAWTMEVHNAWLEYKLGLGYKLRLGHFDPFFGLEPSLDTHGTLLQTLDGKNIGFKSDWGIGFRWLLEKFDYEAALQLGSGMNIRREDGSFLFTQRIGKPQWSDLAYGVSILYGRTLSDEAMHNPMTSMDMPDKAILKKRIGLDVQHSIRSLSLKGEVAYGKNDDEKVLGLFARTGYSLPSLWKRLPSFFSKSLPFVQALELELQWQSWQENMSNRNSMDITLSLGLSYKLTSRVTIRSAYFHNIDRDKQIFLQLYYYGT